MYTIGRRRTSSPISSFAPVESPQSDEVEGILLRRTEVLLQRTYAFLLRGLRSHVFSQTETKESKWDMPDELLLLLEQVEKEGKAAPSNTALVYVFVYCFLLETIVPDG